MRIKPGVNLDGTHWLLWIAAGVADFIRQGHGWGEATITSGTDFVPGRFGAEHARGLALDLRTRDLPGGPQGPQARQWVELCRRNLPMIEWILRADHIHLDLYPGTLRHDSPRQT